MTSPSLTSTTNPGPELPAPAQGRARPSTAWLGLVPFGAYLALFLVLPTVLAIATGFFDKAGAFTWSNLSALSLIHI